MPEIDDAQIRTALEQLRDSAAAEVDVEARFAELRRRVGSRPTGRRWGAGLVATAAAVALLAGSFAVFGGGDRGQQVHTGPDSSVMTPDPAAKEDLDRAMKATLDAPGWVAESSTSARRARFTFRQPDRVDADTFDLDGVRVERLIVIGSDGWFADGNGWVPQQRDWRSMFPFTALDALALACAAHTEDGLLVWRDGGPCDAPLDSSDRTTDVWRVTLDDDGRVATIETVNEFLDPEMTGPGLNQAARLPVTARFRITFRYDHVPGVDVPRKDPSSLPATPNDAEAIAYDAFEAVGWEPVGEGLLNPGSTSAEFHVAFGSGIITVIGTPVQDRTFERDGAPAVFALDNDATAAEPIDLDDTPGIAAVAGGYPFIAFTCGEHLWTVSGLRAADWPPTVADLVTEVAETLAGALECEPGPRPVAPGQSDPNG